jgi:hypothetical protein
LVVVVVGVCGGAVCVVGGVDVERRVGCIYGAVERAARGDV